MRNELVYPLQAPVVVQDSGFLYPFMITPIFIDGSDVENLNAVNRAVESDELVFITSSRDMKKSENKEGSEFDFYEVGVIGHIMRKVALPDGRVKILFQGLQRAKILKILNQSPLIALIDTIQPIAYPQEKADALIEVLRENVKIMANANQHFPPDLLETIEKNKEPNRIIDFVASAMHLEPQAAYELFAKVDVIERLELIIELVMKEIQAKKIQKEMKNKVHSRMEQVNKEYFLKEEMKLIQKELGENPKDEEIEGYYKKLEALKPHMSADAYKEVHKQIKRLSRMHSDSSDANLLQNYIEWCLEIPFGKYSKAKLSINALQNQLNSDHYSLEKPKERIVEYFAVRELSIKRKKDLKKTKGTILCFFGPPGVGKTSLANSIAAATKRPLVRIALGGLEDVNELRGHRRTYIGAMPGRITQGLIEAKEMNPVVVLDEIDKIAKSYRGDPTSVLLEILDPEQNVEFRDYYTNFNLDLSQVIFIATANDVSAIPPPLRDRMEFIEISSYTPNEKFEIAKKYLIPQELEKHALKSDEVKISAPALREIIEKYTREAGVRNLRRQIANIMRKSAKKILNKEAQSLQITPKNVNDFLHKIVFEHSQIDEQDKIGVTNGLAWTAVGGDVLKIEAIKIKGRGSLTITGSLGDVMKESAQIAHSVVKTLFDDGVLSAPKHFEDEMKKLEKLNSENAKASGANSENSHANWANSQIYNRYDVHLHAPEGATPKDGPSAGITMACSIASILSERAVRADVAMTGELTLNGNVLPIGGLKEKLIAAHKSGIKVALIPQKNYERDLDDIDSEVKEKMQIIGVTHISEVLKTALAK